MIFYFLDLLDPKILNFQVPKSQNFWISRSPDLQIPKIPDFQVPRFPDAADDDGRTLRSQPDPSPNAPRDQIRRKGPCCDFCRQLYFSFPQAVFTLKGFWRSYLGPLKGNAPTTAAAGRSKLFVFTAFGDSHLCPSAAKCSAAS